MRNKAVEKVTNELIEQVKKIQRPKDTICKCLSNLNLDSKQLKKVNSLRKQAQLEPISLAMTQFETSTNITNV